MGDGNGVGSSGVVGVGGEGVEDLLIWHNEAV